MTDATYRIVRAAAPSRAFFALRWTAVVFCLAACLWAAQAQAAAPQRFILGSPKLEVGGGTLYALCSVGVNDEDGLRDMLKDGAMLELRIAFDIERERSWWSNAGVASGVFVSGLRHDPLTREFILTLPEDGRETLHKDRNLTRLLHATWRSIRFPLVPQALFEKHDEPQTYAVVLTFDLTHTELPPWLEKSPGFWSSDVVRQERRELMYSF